MIASISVDRLVVGESYTTIQIRLIIVGLITRTGGGSSNRRVMDCIVAMTTKPPKHPPPQKKNGEGESQHCDQSSKTKTKTNGCAYVVSLFALSRVNLMNWQSARNFKFRNCGSWRHSNMRTHHPKDNVTNRYTFKKIKIKNCSNTVSRVATPFEIPFFFSFYVYESIKVSPIK